MRSFQTRLGLLVLLAASGALAHIHGGLLGGHSGLAIGLPGISLGHGLGQQAYRPWPEPDTTRKAEQTTITTTTRAPTSKYRPDREYENDDDDGDHYEEPCDDDYPDHQHHHHGGPGRSGRPTSRKPDGRNGPDGNDWQRPGGSRGSCSSSRDNSDRAIKELLKQTNLKDHELHKLRDALKAMLKLAASRRCKSRKSSPADESQLVVRALDDVLQQLNCVCKA